MILNTSIHENCEQHNAPEVHCHWCGMEIVSTVMDICVLKITH